METSKEFKVETYMAFGEPRLSLTLNITGYESTTFIIQGEEHLLEIKDAIEDILQEKD